MDGLCFRTAVGGGAIPATAPISGGGEMRAISAKVSAVSGSGMSSSERAPQAAAGAPRARPYTNVKSWQMRRLWPGNDEGAHGGEEEVGRGNWVLKILRVGSIWAGRGKGVVLEGEEEEEVEETIGRSGCCGGDGSEGCDVGEEEEMEFDRDSFSKLLRRVSLVEAKLYAKLSYLEAAEDNNPCYIDSGVASFVATTNSVTAVVSAKETAKEVVVKDLNSAQSSPCEWFVCDEDGGTTRYFVIQGSESLASWQANLLFEPIQFEGLEVLVHRGIYEAAKGIYEQVVPDVRSHLSSRGRSATLRFTGHSLGGSLALLVNLMLLIRGEAPVSSLLPVVMFGSPSIMCGGDYLLRKLGLPRSHVQAVTMHRDIVPRAFSCNYPDHIAEVLKAINGNFRNHPCLESQKLLYAPMGELLILQPEEEFSPHHHLLPSGSGLYLLTRPASKDPDRVLRAAQSVFLNSPHPLEILRDRSAYGPDGSIFRDHDMNSYLRTVRAVIRQDLKQARKADRERRRRLWWPALVAHGLRETVVVERGGSRGQTGFLSGAVRTGRESVKRFGRLVASQHVRMLVVLLFPARLLLLGTLTVVNRGL
ncbi:hypothetical protein QJS04_geneDACA007122 [Acorus gramineus]|uniref:Fungal lipase-type domain-containing protein n=1 Tax=Acorus gramineus TaxID=55184 RepID=A0AAV9BSR7_ACOGR|nr:hypothetical protein QJS04_geneDACA007122 [Acorus gramineus]